jgi:molybdenum cofactor cytidylyltransferase
MIALLVLAAGESRRMGYPKPLLRYRGKTFLESILDAASAAGLEKCLIALAPDADNVLQAHQLLSGMVVRNEAPEAGPIGSIRAGIRAVLNHPVEALLVWPVDHPHVSVSTVQALVARFYQTRAAIVVPVYRGRRGHPVLFSRSVFEELLESSDSEGARAVVRKDPNRVTEVPVGDPAILEGIDTPAQYEALLRRSAFPEARRPENSE